MATTDVELFGAASLRIGELAETTVAQVYPHTWVDSGGGNDDHFLSIGAYDAEGWQLTGIEGTSVPCAVAHRSDPMAEYISRRYIDFTIRYKELHDLLECMAYDHPPEDAVTWDDTNHQYNISIGADGVPKTRWQMKLVVPKMESGKYKRYLLYQVQLITPIPIGFNPGEWCDRPIAFRAWKDLTQGCIGKQIDDPQVGHADWGATKYLELTESGACANARTFTSDNLKTGTIADDDFIGCTVVFKAVDDATAWAAIQAAGVARKVIDSDATAGTVTFTHNAGAEWEDDDTAVLFYPF